MSIFFVKGVIEPFVLLKYWILAGEVRPTIRKNIAGGEEIY